MTGRKPKGLDFPGMPDEFEYVWRWFVRIANAGEVNLQTIESFSKLMRVDILPDEVGLILDFDLVRRKVEDETINAMRTKARGNK